MHNEIRLRVADARVVAKLVERGADGVRADVGELAVNLVEAPSLGRADGFQDLVLVGRGDISAKSDQ